MMRLPEKARRHVGTEARSVRQAAAFRLHVDRAFSLIEVLLAIFILGIGVISIAALFPAGIAQQRQSVDDIIGPQVANNAITILRSKIRPSDFGSYEDFTIAGNAWLRSPRPTIGGDWPWMRPGFIFADDLNNTPPPTGVDEKGAIDIFSGSAAFFGGGAPYATEWDAGYANSDPPLRGIPYNRQAFGTPPIFLFTRQERYYPMATQLGALDQAKPQYVWDCMFRRFQGKILVAIFVYRVAIPGGGNVAYSVAQSQAPPPDDLVPPIPVWMNLAIPANMQWSAGGMWDVGGLDFNSQTGADNAFVYGTAGGTPLNVDDALQAWQEPRQWILDQNNNIYRVLGVVRPDDLLSANVEVELTRPVAGVLGRNDTLNNPPPILTDTPFYYVAAPFTPPNPTNSPIVYDNVVTDIWYLPLTMDMDVDSNGTPDTTVSLTPVYVTVKEL